MSRVLEGTAALITGGGGGFGSATALRLARDGAAVTLMGRTESLLEEVADRIAAASPDAPAVRWAVARAVAAAGEGGRLAACVATVGGGTMAPVLGLSAETVRADFDKNVVSALHLVRHGGAALAELGGGSIVCTSSTAGGMSFPFMGSYSIAKSALEALVKVAADELGRVGVRVNAVRPGLVPTRAAKPGALVADPEQRARVLREKPLARVGTAEDVAEAIRYLAGPESSWVTGVVLPVEGGNHLRRAADLEQLARDRCGDDVVDSALTGRLPEDQT